MLPVCVVVLVSLYDDQILEIGFVIVFFLVRVLVIIVAIVLAVPVPAPTLKTNSSAAPLEPDVPMKLLLLCDV